MGNKAQVSIGGKSVGFVIWCELSFNLSALSFCLIYNYRQNIGYDSRLKHYFSMQDILGLWIVDSHVVTECQMKDNSCYISVLFM